MPPVWSPWWCVTRMSVSFQPVALSAASTGAASGASIAAVAAAAGIVQQHAEIVLQAHEKTRLRWHGNPLSFHKPYGR